MGEDIKMLKDFGFMFILLIGIILVVWVVSKLVVDEIEGWIVFIVFLKLIGCCEFIFGKFIGIVWVIGILFVIFGFGFFFVVGYKFVYDVWELVVGEVFW